MAESISSRQTKFFGRDTEIGTLTDDLTKLKSVRFVVGESGVGKSRLLDGFYDKLNDNSEFFIGYYDRQRLLVSESQSIAYPFNIALISLIQNIKKSETTSEKAKTVRVRLRKALIAFSKESGKKLLEAIVEDIAKKAGVEQTYSFAKLFLKTFKAQKSSIMLTEEFISKNKDDILSSYLDIFQSLVREFTERSFVLIFDQIETAGKASIDFLLNFVKLMPDKIHLVVAYKIQDLKWGDQTDRKLFEDTRDTLLFDLRANELKLEGLSEDAIGKWIKLIKNVQLPLVPDLRRIRENSGGLPLILEPWINQEGRLDYEDIKRDQLCQQLIRASRDLDDEDKIKAFKDLNLTSAYFKSKTCRILAIDQY